MRGTMKAFIAVLSMCICFSSFPSRITLAASSQGNCGDGLKWEYKDDTLTISYTGSGTGVMDNYDNEDEDTIVNPDGSEEYIYYYNYPWKAYRNTIRTVVISKGITTVGRHAFAGCKNIRRVSIPEGVTSVGDGAFEQSGSESGFGVVIPRSVTKIGDNAFNGSTLSNIVMREGVKTIGWGAFMDCSKLKRIRIPGSVASIGNFAFYRCRALVKVSGGARLESIGSSAFAFCPKLKAFVISSAVLKKIGRYAFNRDKALKVIQIRNAARLSKAGVEKSLKGSSVRTVKVKKSKVKKNAAIFRKANSGRRIVVKR